MSLEDKLAEVRQRLWLARASFDSVTEPELVDKAIYEINALRADYAYYLRAARKEYSLIMAQRRQKRRFFRS